MQGAEKLIEYYARKTCGKKQNEEPGFVEKESASAENVLDSEEKTAGGIIIPDTAKEKPQEGEVVAVGPGAKTEEGKLIKMDVKVGYRVLFGKWSGTEVKIDGKEYSIMKESDIMGISKGK
jgi:chaperonin GroES